LFVPTKIRWASIVAQTVKPRQGVFSQFDKTHVFAALAGPSQGLAAVSKVITGWRQEGIAHATPHSTTIYNIMNKRLEIKLTKVLTSCVTK